MKAFHSQASFFSVTGIGFRSSFDRMAMLADGKTMSANEKW
jgi:hypothetical protein